MRLPVVCRLVAPPAAGRVRSPVVERESLVEGDRVQPLVFALLVAAEVRLAAEVHQGHSALVLRPLQTFSLLLARIFLAFGDRRDRDVVLAKARAVAT